MTLVLIAFTNLSIIGIILIGYISSLPQHGSFNRLWVMIGLSGIVSAYLALRIKLQQKHRPYHHAFPVHSLGMFISAILPLAAYLVFDLALVNLRVAPLFFAQSVFMILVLGIMMQTNRHSY
jgi:hypothetical protein